MQATAIILSNCLLLAASDCHLLTKTIKFSKKIRCGYVSMHACSYTELKRQKLNGN